MPDKLYRILKKTKLNTVMLSLYKRMRKRSECVMTIEEADTVLQATYPFRSETALLEVPRDWKPEACDLSVIIPCYNNASYIEGCIESVLAQKSRYSYEIIVVDDGSTDDTGQKLARFDGNPAVAVIKQENQGVSSARNHGLDVSSGRYIMFLDGDDALLPGVIQKMMDCACLQNAVLVEGGYQKIDMDGKYLGEYIPQGGKVTAADQMHGFIWMKVMKRCVWDQLQYPLNMIHQDSVMAQIIREKIILDQQIAWRLNCAIGQYRYNTNGITQKNKSRPRSVDTVWITQVLLNDRKKLSLPVTQTYYDHLLDMALLSWRRTSGMSLQNRQAVFVKYRHWILAEGKGFSVSKPGMKMLEQAILNNDFQMYEVFCRMNN